MVARKSTAQRTETQDQDRPMEPKSPSIYGHHRQRGDFGRRFTQRSWLAVLSTCGFAALCFVVTYHVLQAVLISQKAAQHLHETTLSSESYYRKTLSFDVCNGMANQRLSLLYGVVLAYELGRAAVIPDLVLSGVQWSSADTLAAENNTVPFASIYDVKAFKASLSAVGVELLEKQFAPPRELYTAVDIRRMPDPVAELNSQYKNTNHLYVGCPLFKLHSYYLSGANNRVMWAAVNGIKPNKQLERTITPITKRLQRTATTHRYNFVHLRIEDDWVLHCKRWTAIPDGKVRNNCMNNTETLDNVLVNMNVSVMEPLYVASFWEMADQDLANRVLSRLEQAGYNVVTSKQFASSFSGDREVNAIIEYEVAMASYKFLGNSVSTFSALALFQRRNNGLWGSYYNGGNIPASEFLPMELLPWVFTYTSGDPAVDYMVMAAVTSATKYNTLKPYCLWSGNTSVPIFTWMQQAGVTVIPYEPAWIDDVWAKVEPLSAEYSKHSRIYTSRMEFVDNMKRVDLPIIPELEQYTYVLFTEHDVFFHRKVAAATFTPPLPQVVGFPADPNSPASAHQDGGIMLINLPAARETYDEFKVFIMENSNGFIFPNYGIGAAGAYLQFYYQTMQADQLSGQFAAKPFRDFQPSAYIVHWQGPKPHQYVEFFKTMQCSYGSYCVKAFKKALCPYAKKWHSLLENSNDTHGLKLWYACTLLYAPHLKGISSKAKEILHKST